MKEERIIELLAFVDKLMDKEMYKLLCFGLEGIHYEIQNGEKRVVDQDLYDAELAPLGLFAFADYNRTERLYNADRILSVVNGNKEHALLDPMNAVTSKILNTETSFTVSNPTTLRAVKDFIVGEQSEEDWESYVSNLMASGGAEELEKLNGDYHKDELQKDTEPTGQVANPNHTVTVWLTSRNSFLERVAGYYNSENPDVSIIIEYVENFDSRLPTEIMSGGGPDLFTPKMPILSYIEKGALADIKEFILADGELRVEDFRVIEGMEVDGKIYAVPLSFIFPIYGVKEEIATFAGLQQVSTVEDFILSSEKIIKEGSYPFANGEIVSMLKGSLYYGIENFMDYNKKKAEFDSSKFIRFLELFGYEYKAGMTAPKGTEAIIHSGLIRRYSEYEGVKRMKDGSEGRIIFQPTLDETDSIIAVPIFSLSMNKSSENKMHVWGFLKACLSETVQSEMPLDYGFPVNQKARQKLAASAEKQGVDSTSIAELNSIIDSCRISLADTQIFSIIDSELDQLIAGHLTPEETASNIQSKVETYLMEQGGSIDRGYTVLYIALAAGIALVATFIFFSIMRRDS